MTSIRRRTSMLVAAIIAGLLALGGLALFVVVQAALTRQFDDGLASRAAALQSLTRFEHGSVEMDFAGEVMPRYQAGTDAEYFTAWVRDGNTWRVLERSESLRGGAWPARTGEPPTPGIVDDGLPDGRAGRVLTIEFRPRAEHEGAEEHEAAPTHESERTSAPVVRLLVAQSRQALDAAIRTIALSIGGVGLVLVLASIAATRWAVRRGTRPLADLSVRVASIGPDSLDKRLDASQLPAELVPVAQRLNDLLAHLDNAFARERRFTSAASHELRTPIAELRMLLEVGLSQPRASERWEQTARDGLGVLDRAQRLTEALLRLSRAEVRATDALGVETTDLAAILRQQAARALHATGHDPSHVLIDAPATLPARVDPALAASIIGNLIDNALMHGDVNADHPACCVASRENAGTSIVVINHAPGLSDADIGFLFEPFWRKDAARAPHGGFGLGLSVSRALATSCGGRIAATLDARHHLRVEFHAPASE